MSSNTIKKDEDSQKNIDFSRFKSILSEEQYSQFLEKVNANLDSVFKEFLSERIKENSNDVQKNIFLPLSIFKTKKLSCLEIVIKYLHEELKLSIKHISKIIKKNYSTVWNTYTKSVKKYPARFVVSGSDMQIPVSIFENGLLGPLECLVIYLKEGLHMRNTDISGHLQKSPKTIWSTYDKASKKMKR